MKSSDFLQNPLALPVTGSWNGDGTSKTGIWLPASSLFFINVTGKGDWAEHRSDIRGGFYLGKQGDMPISGNWDGSGKYNVGVRSAYDLTFKIKVSTDLTWNPDKGDTVLGPFGGPDDMPLAGDWTGRGKSHVGAWNPHDRCFYLDVNGDGKWDDGDAKLGPFGE